MSVSVFLVGHASNASLAFTSYVSCGSAFKVLAAKIFVVSSSEPETLCDLLLFTTISRDVKILEAPEVLGDSLVASC